MTIRALIAEDEAILAATLARTLTRLWPGLQIVASVTHGAAAVERALALRPDVLFLDIKMPGQNGLDAAEELAERWDPALRFPQVVFVTAYDEYAVQAFERAAADYVLKPVSDVRLARTVARLRSALAAPEAPHDGALAQLVGQLQALLPEMTAPPRLTQIRAAVGPLVRMIPVEQVVLFQALDKYVNVACAEGDALIRMSLKELLPQLDPAQFSQVSRGTVVNLRAVVSASRDEAGRLVLSLRNRLEKPRVSPLYAHLFRQM